MDGLQFKGWDDAGAGVRAEGRETEGVQRGRGRLQPRQDKRRPTCSQLAFGQVACYF
jgi:hypothetical protein